MKILHKLIVMLLCLVSSGVLAVAQEEQRAFFVHRNDGDFNVMFFSQVDSMVYSRIDTDSILRDDYVTQEIWTQDTVVRIPVAAIDSITFQTPSNIYKEDAVIIDQGRQGWIEKVDSLTLYYSLSTPVYLVPEVGEKMVEHETSDLFPNGFIGKVKSVTKNDEYIVVDCDQLSTSDVFDRYYCILEGKCEKTTDGKLRLKRARENGITVPIPSLEFKGEADFGWAWKESEECKFGIGTSCSYSGTIEPTLYYTYIDEYGDKYVCVKLGIDNTFTFKSNLYGGFSLEKDWEILDASAPITHVPILKLYAKVGPRFTFTGNIALDFEQTTLFSLKFTYIWASASGLSPSNGFKKPEFEIVHRNIAKAMGEISVYGGMFVELGIALITDDLGKMYTRGDTGFELGIKADIGKSLDDAYKSTNFYERAEDLVTVSLDRKFGVSSGVAADLLGFHAGAAIEGMVKLNLFERGLIPKFSNTRYFAQDNAESYLTCEIDKDILAAVPVGFKVYDEDGNMVFKEYYTDDYSGSFNEYRIPYTFNKVNTTYTAYPVFKLFGEYEVLASPGVEMKSEVSPVTVGGEAISSDEASISGRLDGDYKFLEVGGYSVGFLYGESAELQESGTSIVVGLNADGTFGSKLIKLKDGTTYYYCAYLKVGGKIYYGEVKSFATPKIPKDAVDLGLSVLWAKYNVGASKEGDCGGLYGWADATGSQTAFDVMSEDGTTWTSPLYGGANPPVSISGNASYDIASSKWGGGWRMPTEAEVIELIDNCTTEYEEIDGVSGVRFTSTINGESIFMPMAGDRFGTEMRETGYTGYYWTGTLNTDNRFNAYRMNFTAAGAEWDNYPRYIGHSVRPVIAKP